MTTPQIPDPTHPAAERSASGFLAALFDLDFRQFVALKFIKVIYVLAMVFIGLAGLAVFIGAVSQGELLAALAALVFLFIYLIFIRVWLEVIALLFRIGEDTAMIRDSLLRGERS